MKREREYDLAKQLPYTKARKMCLFKKMHAKCSHLDIKTGVIYCSIAVTLEPVARAANKKPVARAANKTNRNK